MLVNVLNYLPKHDLNIEKAVLGLFIREDVLLSANKGVIKKEDFYDQRHQSIFQAGLGLLDKGYHPDLLALANLLDKANMLEMVGGRSYLTEVASDLNCSASKLESHIKILKDLSRARKEKHLAQLLVQAIEEEDEDKVRKTKTSLSNLDSDFLISRPQTASELMPDIQERFNNQKSGILSPFPALNKHIGGFGEGELSTLSGNSGAGKSILCLQIALEACKQGKRVLYWNLEMSPAQFMPRLIMQHLGITSFQWKNKSFNWHEAIDEKLYLLEELPIKFMFDITSTNMIYATAYLEKIKHGLDFLIIDYFGMLNDQFKGSEVEKDKYLILKLKEIAKKLNIPVFTPLAVSKQAVRSKDAPQAEDQLGGIMQVYTADMMFAISRKKDSPEGCIYITKNRTGDRGFVNVLLDSEHLKFHEEVKNIEVPEYYNDL